MEVKDVNEHVFRFDEVSVTFSAHVHSSECRRAAFTGVQEPFNIDYEFHNNGNTGSPSVGKGSTGL